MKKTVRIAAVVSALTLTLAACGERAEEDADTGSGAETSAPAPESSAPATEPTETETSAAVGGEQFPDFKACMVSDSGGFDDRSFNQTSYAGLTNAADNLGVQTSEAESNDPSEFETNIANLVDQDCNQITTVGFLLGDATLAAAEQSPNVDFAIVDFAYSDDAGANIAPDNLKGLVFDTAGPSFLAGYTAAATSESGIVGTFGGQQIPSVTVFMDGFANGVAYYNEQKDAEVEVLGWDVEGQEGSFTDSFEDQTAGQSIGEQFISQGADVIFPVAGPAGLGGLQAAEDNDAYGIWVDTDGCQSTDYCDILLTSVEKGMDVAVEQAILDSAGGQFDNQLYNGTLENGGVGLADFGDAVSDETATEVEEIRQGLIDGSISAL